jgi:hypothetical protein
LGVRPHKIKKDAEASVVVSKETGLGVNAGETNYVVMFLFRTL